MARKEELIVKKHLSMEELNKTIRVLETEMKILRRLRFIKCRYEGKSVDEAARVIGVSRPIAYDWQQRWNAEGYKGLIPKYAGGRPSKLSDAQKEVLRAKLQYEPGLTTEQVRDLIYQDFGVEYTTKQVRLILKKIGPAQDDADAYEHPA